MWKIGLTALAVGLVLAPAAEARHRRVVATETDVRACVLAQNIPPYIFPAPAWEPFFRHHMYVGPVISCMPVDSLAVPVFGPVVSAKY
jgi:hypothetical protein